VARVKNVRALDDTPGRKLENIFDARRKRYYAPPPSIPLPLRLLSLILSRLVGQNELTAILDTGMLSRHPFLRKRIADSVDFTGEGPEDLNGHGTAVSLIFCVNAPGIRVLNVKVLDQDKEGFEDDLVAGLRWAEKHKATAISLSVGIERDQDCGGKCDICRETDRIIRESHIIITAAVGNTPGVITCPARCRDVIATTAFLATIFIPVKWWEKILH
jgi:hypothetical protein